ncbi:DNA-directed RNA polymerase sigma-70 factor [Micromonospora sonchi]|uniref:DNA-directed RNA polymerase sigma-70 factor n=1 Tax=Micromonospora sonchi TaxID=1763543 RepID=A0A917X167_9ACTN|nr:SigE family RNA polymerase sigma factor [Micromonospora sonchi]GGM51178.1 DNA-directed RNA polymerase sigma-70 factor [Micromonospora sonchi]
MDLETRQDFTAFVGARSHALFRTALALTGHRQQAEDLLQTVLAKAYRHWGKVRHGQPEAYLRRALYREQVSWWRRPMRSREVVTDRLPDVASTDLTGRVDLSMALRASLDRLAPKQRAVLVLRYLEDLSDEEIADILRCKPTTVRSQAARALDRIRTLCPELTHLAAQEVHQ